MTKERLPSSDQHLNREIKIEFIDHVIDREGIERKRKKEERLRARKVKKVKLAIVEFAVGVYFMMVRDKGD